MLGLRHAGQFIHSLEKWQPIGGIESTRIDQAGQVQVQDGQVDGPDADAA